MSCEWHDKIFNLKQKDFEEIALEVFQFQYRENKVYRSYVKTLGKSPAEIRLTRDIPFLPIGFFKTNKVVSGDFDPEIVFESSGTTQAVSSKHYIKDLPIYTESFTKCFSDNYGQIGNFCMIGLLPSYLEKGNSSLVYMVDWLIKNSGHPLSGFYLYDHDKLAETIKQLEAVNQPTILFGVTYALLDFAEYFSSPLKNTIIIETGGMKGRKEELTRMEVHDKLKKAFSLEQIHSEYGMTELLSQAYAKKEGKFYTPGWMKVLIRDDEDPLTIQRLGKKDPVQNKALTGAINIIDLANVYSCSFIATDDVGKLYADGSFEVLGRLDGSDLRGCSLLTV